MNTSREFVAIYLEREQGHYELVAVFHQERLEENTVPEWLEQLCAHLAQGDLWAVERRYGDELSEFVTEFWTESE